MELKKILEKAAEFTGGGRLKTNLLIILAAAAAVLLMLSDISCAQREEPQDIAFSCENYADGLEEKLEKMISSMDGAGETRVMVTLQNSSEYIYASEDALSTDSSESTDSSGRQSTDERQDRKSSYIIIDTEEGEQALVRTELMPTVNGVVVLCRGAGDPQVAQQIMAVVTTALNISSKRVCITQLSQ